MPILVSLGVLFQSKLGVLNIFIYDYFSATLRERETFSQEFRLISDTADFDSNKNYEWVLGLSYFDIKEMNLKNDDGIYGDPSDPFGPYASESSFSSSFSSDKSKE